MEVALLQSTLFWEDPEANRRHFSGLIGSLDPGVDLIVLPEMFTTGFTMEPARIPPEEGPRTLEWMRQQASLANAGVVGSIACRDEGGFRNRLVFTMPDGTHGTYDKRQTFTLAGEDKVYRRGTERVLVSFRGFRICPLICYDLRFPVWSRNTEDYDVLIYVANWPSPRVRAWDTLLCARAIENMSYVVGVNRVGSDPNGHSYSGHSAVFDSLGQRLAYSEAQEVLRVRLSRSHLEETRGSLRFLQDRDAFTLGS